MSDGPRAAATTTTTSLVQSGGRERQLERGPSGPHFLGFSARLLKTKSYFFQVVRKIRRAYLSTFRPTYVKQSIAEKREGDCNQCGACCKLVYRCPFLAYDEKKLSYCRIYGILRPAACKNYPFDEIDSEIEDCSFTFKK